MSGIMVVDQEDTPQSKIPLQSRPEMEATNTEAQAQCLQLSTLMYERLPRELRDLVYNYLCLEDRQVPYGPYYHFRKYEPAGSNATKKSNTKFHPRSGDLQTELSDGKTRTDHDVYPEDDLILPSNHIFNADYMGQQVVLELLKKYYSSNTFSVCNVEGGLDDLCTAVASNADGAAFDFVPLDHIHDLQIRVKCEHFPAKVSSTSVDAGPRLKELAEKMLFLRRAVESLRVFRSRVQATSHPLNIEFVLMLDLMSSDYHTLFVHIHVVNFLQTIRNTVYELMHNREHTTVRVTSQDDGLWAFPRNYTGLFTMTKEKWSYEKSRQRPDYDWSGDFWTLPLAKIGVPASDILDLGGYCVTNLNHSASYSLSTFLAPRWGITDILRETTSSVPTQNADWHEDINWPVGRPFDHRFLQRLIDRAALGVAEGIFSEADAWSMTEELSGSPVRS